MNTPAAPSRVRRRSRRALLPAALALFAALGVAFPASGLAVPPILGQAPAKMYWTAGDSNGAVGVGELLGEGIFDPRPLYGGERFPTGVTLDPGNNRVYWSARTADGNGAIRDGALDGSTPAATLYETPEDGSLPLGLGIWTNSFEDLASLFWAQQPVGGGDWEVWGGYSGGSYRGPWQPVPGGPANALVVDSATTNMYWTNGGAVEIGKATGSGLRYVLRSSAAEARAVAYAQGRIYWISTQGGDLTVYSGIVGGSDVEPLYEEEDSTPLGGLVIARGKLYWTADNAAGPGTVMSGSLAGGGSPEVFEPGLGAQFLAFLEPARSTAPPWVTGGVKQGLTCGGDRWAGNLTAQAYFAAPTTVTYEWRRDGVVVGTGETLWPTEPGTYSCSALGKNAAGGERVSSNDYDFSVAATLTCRNVSLATIAGQTVTGHLPCTGSGPISYVVASGPRHGRLTSFDPATGSFGYEPNGGFTGSDSFHFRAIGTQRSTCGGGSVPCDRPIESSLALATIQVSPARQPAKEVTPPSNRFRLLAPRLNKRAGTARLRLRVPGPGVLRLRGKRVRAAKVEVDSAGTATLVVRPKRAARRQLLRRGRARVKVVVRFAPDGGTPRSLVRAVTLRQR